MSNSIPNRRLTTPPSNKRKSSPNNFDSGFLAPVTKKQVPPEGYNFKVYFLV